MSEIKNDLIQLYPGDDYKCRGEDYVITEDNSINDILRFCISQGAQIHDFQIVIDKLTKDKG